MASENEAPANDAITGGCACGTVRWTLSAPPLGGGMTRARAEGLPDDDWRKHDARFREPLLSEHLALVERLSAVAERHGTTPGAVAVAWTLRHPAVHGAIVGFRRPDQVDPIVAAADLELSDDDVAEILGDA